MNKVLLMILAFWFLATAPAMALEACNRYDDTVDECYENYYRNASNYDYRGHKECSTVDQYGQCAGGVAKPARQVKHHVVPNVRCRYDRYYGKIVCDDVSVRYD